MKRQPRALDPFLRGFLIARLYEQGAGITSELIRAKTGVSCATAKRDMTALESVVPVTQPAHRGLPRIARRPDRPITVPAPTANRGVAMRALVRAPERDIEVDLTAKEPYEL
jgi:hypothetical protein